MVRSCPTAAPPPPPRRARCAPIGTAGRPDRGGRCFVTQPIRPGLGRPGVPPPRPGHPQDSTRVPEPPGPGPHWLTGADGSVTRVRRRPEPPAPDRRSPVGPAGQRQRLDRAPPPRPYQHGARSDGSRERRDPGHRRCRRGARAGRTTGAGPAAGDRRRSPRRAPSRARRGSGRPRPVTRAWIARDAPALPRTSTRPGRGPTARPRATACRMFSDWVPTRRCPGSARQHNRTSQSCSTVAPAGIGPYPRRAPTWCGVSVRAPSSRLRTAIRPYPSEPTAPIHT